MEQQTEELLQSTVDEGLYRIILSNPRHKDGEYKAVIRPVMIGGRPMFQKTAYVGTKVYHENLERAAVIGETDRLLTDVYRQCEIEHRKCRATVLVSKKGRRFVKRKKTENAGTDQGAAGKMRLAHNRVKKYILEEGVPVPFLVDLGVQTADGRIVRQRYDKFKQINRFLELIEDILPTLSREGTLHIVDFGCGKSYLTFAVYYYLHELKGYDVEITGLDLKEDVIDRCSRLSRQYGYEKLHFRQGDIADYQGQDTVDMVITLHACDTATDYALAQAVRWGARVILSVPCCQHEVNGQIRCDALSPLLKYGIVKERMAALITDAVRAEILNAQGYETGILEFIDMEHTPKNLLIRAVRQEHADQDRMREAARRVVELTEFLHIDPTLMRLLMTDGGGDAAVRF